MSPRLRSSAPEKHSLRRSPLKNDVDAVFTPRRSPRLSPAAINTRLINGRLLNCTPKATGQYRSPLANYNCEKTLSTPTKQRQKKISETVSDELPNVSLLKRKSTEGLTPLRIELDSDASSTSSYSRRPSLAPQHIISMRELEAPIDVISPRSSKIKSSIKCDFCGLPPKVKQVYIEKRKITKLYDWQTECLGDERLRRGSNCIISLPTGAGKTLIAEVLMLREAIVKNRSSILVLPYVAIVQEKIASLSVFNNEFGINIEEYAATKGRIPPIKRRKGASIYVATIEKANMLINSMIESNKLIDIGLVVVDELHMIGDGQRGSIIEQMIAKYLYKGSGQIVGMSATLPNMDDLCKFLRAYVYSTEFRPIELIEYVRIGQAMWRVLPGGRLIHSHDLPTNTFAKIDPDGVIQLLQNIIPDKSVIIFCPTKKNCHSLAALIANFAPRHVREKKKEEKLNLIQAIKDENDGKIDGELEKCLLSGIAYHHSGLTNDERKLIEAAYVDGVLCVVCATSTLAAGVNMPARRVIIKSPTIGRDSLGKAQYQQMIGRAGRAGFDNKGESIIIAKPGVEEKQLRSMLSGPIATCSSSLLDATNINAFLLDAIALKMGKCIDSLMLLFRYTLLNEQKDFAEMRQLVSTSIDHLVSHNLVHYNAQGELSCSQLGAATFGANISPSVVNQLNNDLTSTLTTGLVFSSHFHLLFTISPYDASCNVDWDLLHTEYQSLPVGEKALLSSSGLPERSILQSIMTKKNLIAGEPAMRLYLALMLQKIWNQEPHHTVAQRFGVDRGWMQSTIQSTVAQAAAVSKFSEALPSLWPLRLLLPELVQRLSDCVNQELIPLMAIEGVKRGRAKQLVEAGYRNLSLIANADAQQMVKDIAHLQKFQANRIINSAKSILRDRIDEKMEEMEAMGLNTEQLFKAVSNTN